MEKTGAPSKSDLSYMRLALRLAKKGYGCTSPNPMVGAVLVRNGRLIGEGWHRRAGMPHAEIEALEDAKSRGESSRGATLYVTLEPCCTHGRTPPCTAAILQSGIRRVVVAATDPNPVHCGKGLRLLRQAGLDVQAGVLASEAALLNEAFNHWIVHRTPFVIIKAAMSLDGKIGTETGESKWITGPAARKVGMRLRKGADAILVGINTVIADDPALTVRQASNDLGIARELDFAGAAQRRRIVLDSNASTPLGSRIVSDAFADKTTIVVTRAAPRSRVEGLKSKVNVWIAPSKKRRIDVPWVLRRLGGENVVSLLVEGGGEANASLLSFAHRVVFFYAPMVIGGAAARKAVAGRGAEKPVDVRDLVNLTWRRVGADLMLSANLNHVYRNH